jgi:hypothetical protein
MIGILAEGEATGIFNTPTLWAEFIAAVLGIAVIAIWRLVNKYLPPDEHGPPPINVAAAAVDAMTEVVDRNTDKKKKEPVMTEPDVTPEPEAHTVSDEPEVLVLDEVDTTEEAGEDAGDTPSGWTPEGGNTKGEEFAPESVKGDE